MKLDDLTPFQYKMFMLDAALTGNGAAKVWSVLKDQPKTAKEWVERGEVWYLSDCGLSRIAFSEIEGTIWLTSNSMKRVKNAWSRCAELIADVEAELRKGL